MNMNLTQGFTAHWLQWVSTAIELPEPVTEAVLGLLPQLDRPEIIALAGGLTEPDTAENACKALCEKLRPDQDGYKILTVHLAALSLLPARLEKMGLGMDVFLATARVFTRFVNEHMASFGRYGFDRCWWTWRQTAGLLVRLGVLEFERIDCYSGPEFSGLHREQPVIGLHIPGGSKLTDEGIQASLSRARALWPGRPIVCHSWLLAPALETLLPEGGIRTLRHVFTPGPADPSDNSFIQWIFCDTSLAPQQWPEDTRLRRAVKAYVLSGGQIGAGWGLVQQKNGE